MNCRGRRGIAGFSLVEILVAMAVVLVFMLIAVQISASASRASRQGLDAAEGSAVGRGVMDMIARDLDGMVRRDDLAAFPAGSSGDAEFAFYTKLAGLPDVSSDPGQVRSLSLVSYRLNPGIGDDLPWLGRADLAIEWNQKNRVRFGEPTELTELANATERQLLEGALGFDYVFLMADGTATRSPAVAGGRIAALRVTLAAVDIKSAELLRETGKVTQLLAFFRDGVGAPEVSARLAWQAGLNEDAIWETLPEPVRSALIIFERTIVLPGSTERQ